MPSHRPILLINHYAGSPDHGMEFRPYYFAREWNRLDIPVTVIAASYSHLRQKNPDVKGPWLTQVIDGTEYLWLKTPSYHGNGLKRVINMLCFVLWLFVLVPLYCLIKRPSMVIASSTYPLDIFPAWLGARLGGSKLVFEVHDLWPLSPIELSNFSPKHPFIRVMQMAENFAYRHSDKAVSLLPKAQQHMIDHGLSADKFCEISNGIVPEEWQSTHKAPAAHVEKISRFREDFPFLIGYMGGHAISNALDFIVQASEKLKHHKIGIVMVGSGAEKNNLIHLAKDLGVSSKLLFLSSVPKKAVPETLALFDALYIGARRLSIYRFGVCPNKLFDYMMSARPIIYAIEAGNDPVSEAQCGETISAEDPDAIARAAIKLSQMSRDQLTCLGKNGREFVLKNNDYKKLAERFLQACL